MRLYITTLFTFISLSLFSQTKPLEQEYQSIFSLGKLELGERVYPKYEIKELPNTHVLAGLVNDNRLYLDYIYTNYTTRAGKDNMLELMDEDDSIARNKKFIELLKSDTVFGKYFSTMVMYYLPEGSKEYTYKNTINTKDTLTIDSLVAIGSKFFHLNRITSRGCHWAICVGKNGYKNLMAYDGKPLIEAFCFNAILSNVSNEKYEYYKEYKENMNSIKPKDFEGADSEVLEQMRNTMYENMQNSESLKKLLMDKYAEMKDKLSFVLN